MWWVSFILGLNFIFLRSKLIILDYRTQKQRKIKFKARIKLTCNIDIRPFHSVFKLLTWTS